MADCMISTTGKKSQLKRGEIKKDETLNGNE
jgi:hypothetical protein